MSMMGQIGSERMGELIIVRQSQVEIQREDPPRSCFMCTNTKTLTSLKLATKTPQHFLFFSGFVLILSSSFSLSVYMNDSACICAGSIHKRPSVQSDKVPISQSCDSDFLSVCQTAAEGLSIRARAHILSHLLKHKLTRARREA